MLYHFSFIGFISINILFLNVSCILTQNDKYEICLCCIINDVITIILLILVCNVII